MCSSLLFMLCSICTRSKPERKQGYLNRTKNDTALICCEFKINFHYYKYKKKCLGQFLLLIHFFNLPFFCKLAIFISFCYFFPLFFLINLFIYFVSDFCYFHIFCIYFFKIIFLHLVEVKRLMPIHYL